MKSKKILLKIALISLFAIGVLANAYAESITEGDDHKAHDHAHDKHGEDRVKHYVAKKPKDKTTIPTKPKTCGQT